MKRQAFISRQGSLPAFFLRNKQHPLHIQLLFFLQRGIFRFFFLCFFISFSMANFAYAVLDVHKEAISAEAMDYGVLDQRWKLLAKKDLHSIYREIQDNHPAFAEKNPSDPRFALWVDLGMDQAMEKAEKVSSFAAYRAVLQFYIQGFEDPFLRLRFLVDLSKLLWPGIALAYEKEHHVVKYRAKDDEGFLRLPPLGAKLLSCNGKTPSQLMNDQVYPFLGNSNFLINRVLFSPYLGLVYEHHPWVKPLQDCLFEKDGKGDYYRLSYLPLDKSRWKKIYKKVLENNQMEDHFFSLKEFYPGHFWIRLPTFSPSQEEKTNLEYLLSRLHFLQNERVIVFDLRGNRGGDSYWGDLILEALYGQDFLSWVFYPFEKEYGKDFRVSQGNQKWFEYMGKVERANRMRRVIKSGQTLLRDTLPYLKPFPKELTNPVKAQVVLLTDMWNQGNTLLFIDKLLMIKNILHVGQPTAGNTPYGDPRQAILLPSSLVLLDLPTSVSYGLERKSGQIHIPKHLYHGDIVKTKPLQNWILELLGYLNLSEEFDIK